MTSKIILGVTSSALLIGLPLVGTVLNGEDIRTYLEFPPLTRYVAHAPFHPLAFVIIAALDLMMVAGFITLISKGIRRCRDHGFPLPSGGRFPAWGWLGAALMAGGWWLAWTRYHWFAALQVHTFCFPWTGYIVLVNALCLRRSGHSPLTDSPLRFFLLWPISSLFWWFFEYLNRFVQNWYYLGVEKFSPTEYVLHASLAFATVLPAVVSTHHLLMTFAVFHTGLSRLVPVRIFNGTLSSGVTLVLATTALVMIGRFPDYLYPLVWCAPLLVITSLQTLWNRPTIFDGLAHGDWRAILASATAALVCGFFWELWNYHSLAHWEYAAPFVDRWHIFAMPLLGYGSYLPFGLACLLVGQPVMEKKAKASLKSADNID